MPIRVKQFEMEVNCSNSQPSSIGFQIFSKISLPNFERSSPYQKNQITNPSSFPLKNSHFSAKNCNCFRNFGREQNNKKSTSKVKRHLG